MQSSKTSAALNWIFASVWLSETNASRGFFSPLDEPGSVPSSDQDRCCKTDHFSETIRSFPSSLIKYSDAISF